jgi:hypothetical protein
VAVKMAVQALRDAVAATFTKDGTEVQQLFGWRAVAEQVYSNRRVVWVPGDDSGAVGSVVGAANVGGAPVRNLADFEELCTLWIHATDADPEKAEDEEVQYNECRLVFDAVYRALHHAATGRFKVRSVRWVTEKKLRRWGLAMKVLLEVRATLPDSPLGADDYYTLANGRGEILGANIDVQELERTDRLEVESDDGV